MELPKLGLGLTLIKGLSWSEWERIKKEVEKLLATYGYDIKTWPYGSRTEIKDETEEILSFGRKIKNLAEIVGLKIYGEPKIGTLLSEITIWYYFEHKQSNVPSKIEIVPGAMGQNFEKEEHSMAVIEKIEPILVKAEFFVFYKCTWESRETDAFRIDCSKSIKYIG